MMDVTEITPLHPVEDRPMSPRSLPAPVARLAAVPFVGTLAGLVLVVAGFVLLAVAWGKTAGLTVVGRQLPWLMSAGLTGLGVVCLGLTAIVLDAKARDAARRAEQSVEMRELLAELRTLIEAGR